MAGDFKDLRYLFMRGLIDHEKSQRSRHYLKSAAECTSRAVVSLELAPDPVTTVKQAKRLEGIGGETCTRLAKLDEERNFSSLKPLPGRFVSSAAAILVTLLDLTNEKATVGNNKSKDILIPEETVKTQSRFLCEEQFIEPNNEGFCIAWWRLEVLIKRGFIKRRSQKKKSVLQLLPAGQHIAQRLKGVNGQKSRLTSQTSLTDKNQHVLNSQAVNHKSTGSADSTANEPLARKSLYSNDEGNDRVILLVDTQEMGGERAGLGELCRLLDQHDVSYRTKKLPTGDYSWVWRCGDVEITLPCLAERKRADDIPCTLKEGRFWSQINKMLDWKRGFTDRGIDCNLHYILERKPEEYVVKCTDGCMGIGQCGNPTLSQIKMVIEDLKHHPELLVKETDSLEVTAVLLKSLTNELEQRALKGDFDTLIQQTTGPKPPVKGEIESAKAVTIPETDLSFDEQLKLALENSLMDVGTKPESKETRITTNDAGMIFNNTSNTQRTLRTNKEEPMSNPFDTMIDEPLLDSPLMQYHCTVESSVTCQQSDKGSKFDDYKNEYRPKINRKRIHNTPLSEDRKDSMDRLCSETSKKPRTTTFTDLENTKAYVNNQLREKSDDKEDKDSFSNLARVKALEPNVCGTKSDKTDEILKSLKQASVVKPTCDKIVYNVEDTLEEKEYKPKVRLKPIKMNLSPSKMFIETNIVKVKEESLSPLEFARKKSMKGESGCTKLSSAKKDSSSNKNLQLDIKAVHRAENDIANYETNVNSNETHSLGDINMSPPDSTGQKADNIDSASSKSVEDIFVDTSSQDTDVCEQDKGGITPDPEYGRKVSEWLLNDFTSGRVTNRTDNSGINIRQHSVSCSSDDDGNNSLPDLDFKPDTVNCLGDDHSEETEKESDIVILNDDDCHKFSKLGPSNSTTKPKKKKGRKAHDSGYESEDIRHEGSASVAKTDKPYSTSDSVLESKVETVLGILPYVSRKRVLISLKACGYNEEQCISWLLDQNEFTESNLVESVIDLTD